MEKKILDAYMKAIRDLEKEMMLTWESEADKLRVMKIVHSVTENICKAMEEQGKPF